MGRGNVEEHLAIGPDGLTYRRGRRRLQPQDFGPLAITLQTTSILMPGLDAALRLKAIAENRYIIVRNDDMWELALPYSDFERMFGTETEARAFVIEDIDERARRGRAEAGVLVHPDGSSTVHYPASGTAASLFAAGYLWLEADGQITMTAADDRRWATFHGPDAEQPEIRAALERGLVLRAHPQAELLDFDSPSRNERLRLLVTC